MQPGRFSPGFHRVVKLPLREVKMSGVSAEAVRDVFLKGIRFSMGAIPGCQGRNLAIVIFLGL